MRFVPTKTVEQQSCLMLHRARHLFIRQQTAIINSTKVAAIALANKLARMAWAMMARNERYKEPAALTA